MSWPFNCPANVCVGIENQLHLEKLETNSGSKENFRVQFYSVILSYYSPFRSTISIEHSSCGSLLNHCWHIIINDCYE